ncbi:MAG: putative Peptidase [Chlamydiales bacterium]|jgi:hypothetical protein|nr:putative Peptidase [Chlamydiales bacterium]
MSPIKETYPQTPIFQARYHESNKKPQTTKMGILYDVVSTIIFPIGLARLAKRGIHRLIGRLAILPAQRGKMTQLRKNRAELLASKEYGASAVFFKAADGIQLEGSYIKARQEGSTSKTLIYFNGNGEFLEKNSLTPTPYIPEEKILNWYQEECDQCILEGEELPDLDAYKKQYNQPNVLDIYLNQGYNVLFFHYRGVGASQGTATAKGLIQDGEAAFQYVHSHLGTPEKDIVLFGHSLGGAVAASVAEMHPQVGLCHDRSFSSLNREVYHLLGQDLPWLGSIASKITSALGWEFSFDPSLKKAGKTKLVLYHRKDGVIPYAASLAAHIKAINQSKEKKAEEVLDGIELHALEKGDYSHHFAELEKLFKDGKITERQKIREERNLKRAIGMDYHNKPLSLEETKKVSAYFQEKISDA